MRQTSETSKKMLAGKRLQVREGDGGWLRALVGSEADGRTVTTDAFYIRFADRDGRLAAVEVVHHPLGGRTVDPDLLRVVIGTVDRRVNAPAIADELRRRMAKPGPDIRRAVAAFEGLGSVAVGSGPLDHSWVVEMLLAQRGESAVKNRKVMEPRLAPGPKPGEILAAAEKKCVLTVPEGKPYPEEFYAAVADAYRAIAPWTSKPSVWIEKANPQFGKTQIRGWIATARKRGHLAPGRKGKVG